MALAVEAFETQLPLTSWDLSLRVVISRKRVGHATRKNFQLDLFSPDDGHFEYSAVTTNKALTPADLWAFMAGRPGKDPGRAKGEFAFDVVSTNHYRANSAWQQLSVLAHNLVRNFQLVTLATPKPRSRKRTYACALGACGCFGYSSSSDAWRLPALCNGVPARMSWVGCSRVFDIDVENCPNCGGTLKIIAFWVYKRICFRGQRGQVRKSSFMAKPEEMKVVMACFVDWIRYLDLI